MPWGAIIGGALGLLGANEARKASKEAANIQSDAAREQVELQRESLAQLRQDLDPFRQFGIGALAGLGGSLGIQPQVSQVQDTEARNAALERAKERFDQYYSTGGVFRGDDTLEPGKLTPAFTEKIYSINPEIRQRAEGMLERFQQDELTKAGLSLEPPEFAPAQTATTATLPGAPAAAGVGAPLNPLLARAVEERGAFDPTANALLQRATQERADFDPMGNPLIAQAVQEQQAYDPNAVLGPQLLQNPLLQALQKDVTRRLMANQAARGRLGSGGTAEALQERLVPQAITFGLQLDQLQRQGIQDRARLGFDVLGAQERAIAGREQAGLRDVRLAESGIAGREQTGAALEDLRQRQIGNLQAAAQLGQGSAARQGAAGLSVANQISNLGLFGAQSQALGELQQARAINQGLGALGGGITGLLGGLGFGGGSTFVRGV